VLFYFSVIQGAASLACTSHVGPLWRHTAFHLLGHRI
jgi:hypothetical protein